MDKVFLYNQTLNNQTALMQDQKNYYMNIYTYIEIIQDYIQFDSKNMPKFKA